MHKSPFSLFLIIISAFILSCNSEEITAITLTPSTPTTPTIPPTPIPTTPTEPTTPIPTITGVCDEANYDGPINYEVFKFSQTTVKLDNHDSHEFIEMPTFEDFNNEYSKQTLLNFITKEEYDQLAKTDFSKKTIVFMYYQLGNIQDENLYTLQDHIINAVCLYSRDSNFNVVDLSTDLCPTTLTTIEPIYYYLIVIADRINDNPFTFMNSYYYDNCPVELQNTDPSVCSDSIYSDTISYSVFKTAQEPYLESEPLSEVCPRFEINSIEDLNNDKYKQMLMKHLNENEFDQLTKTDFTQRTVVFYCTHQDNETWDGDYTSNINLELLGICQTSDDAARPYNDLIFEQTGCIDQNATKNLKLYTYILITERKNEKSYGSITSTTYTYCE